MPCVGMAWLPNAGFAVPHTASDTDIWDPSKSVVVICGWNLPPKSSSCGSCANPYLIFMFTRTNYDYHYYSGNCGGLVCFVLLQAVHVAPDSLVAVYYGLVLVELSTARCERDARN